LQALPDEIAQDKLMYFMRTIIFSFLFMLWNWSAGQSQKQQLSGQVQHAHTGRGIEEVKVVVLDQKQHIKASVYTQSDGRFEVAPLLPGTYELLLFHPQYQSKRLHDIELQAGTSTYINVKLEERVHQLEAVIIADSAGGEWLQQLSSHRLKPEKAKLRAGNFRDPSRMLMQFPGLSQADDFQNSLVVRGNSPAGTQWYIEGLPLANPNHLAILGNSGGGYNLLNVNMIQHIDFYPGAFPAKYGNALSGVIDVKLRKGNPTRHQFQLGTSLIDIEAQAEGPLGKRKKASYLLSVRRANLDLAYKWLPFAHSYLANLPVVQDLNYKLFFPMKKGWVSAFGLMGSSTLSLRQSFQSEESIDNQSYTGLWGMSFLRFTGKKSFLKTSLAYAQDYARNGTTSFNFSGNKFRHYISNNGRRLALDFNYTQKIGKKHQLQTGALLQYRLERFMADQRLRITQHDALFFRAKQYGLYQSYIQWKGYFGQGFSANLGIFGLYMGLNHTSSLEPRGLLSWQLSPQQQISLAYGHHSMTQPISIYFSGPKCVFDCTSPNEDKLYFLNLDLNKSRQLALSYLLKSTDFSFKTELYYLRYFHIAHGVGGANPDLISALNYGSNGNIFYLDVALENKGGYGDSYGIELSLEKNWSSGFYTFLSTSLYQATYTDSRNIVHSTAFNGQYNANLLIDKNFKLNAYKSYWLHLSAAVTAAGGRRYTPPHPRDPTIEDNSRPYAARYKHYFRTDLKLGLQQHFSGYSHTLSLDIRNLFDTQNEYFRRYSYEVQDFVTYYQLGFLPLLFYEIAF